MKIVYCLNSIRGLGGIQRVTVIKANALADINGNKVYIIVTDSSGEIQCGELSPKVDLIDLSINYYEDDWQRGIRSTISQIRKKVLHRYQLKNKLNELSPDVVISVGQSEKFFCVKGFVSSSNPIYIREFHFASNYRKHFSYGVKGMVIASLQNFVDFQIMCRFFYDGVVCLTPEDLAQNWSGRKNIYAVPNPVTIAVPPSQEGSRLPKIIAAGRLTKVKNFESLITAFSYIAGSHPNWSLDIYGDGEERDTLMNLIKSLKLDNQVTLTGYTDQVEEFLKKSSIFAATSLTEGFPLVLLEAMVNYLPIVTYKNYGSSFIVQDGKNGYIIELDNRRALAEKLEFLMEKEDVRIKMGELAHERAMEFKPSEIALQWMSLFTSIINKKALNR